MSEYEPRLSDSYHRIHEACEQLLAGKAERGRTASLFDTGAAVKRPHAILPTKLPNRVSLFVSGTGWLARRIFGQRKKHAEKALQEYMRRLDVQNLQLP